MKEKRLIAKLKFWFGSEHIEKIFKSKNIRTAFVKENDFIYVYEMVEQ